MTNPDTLLSPHPDLANARIATLRAELRDDTAFVADALERALALPRGPSFFDAWTFDEWRKAWRTLLAQVADVKHREPVLGTSR